MKFIPHVVWQDGAAANEDIYSSLEALNPVSFNTSHQDDGMPTLDLLVNLITSWLDYCTTNYLFLKTHIRFSDFLSRICYPPGSICRLMRGCQWMNHSRALETWTCLLKIQTLIIDSTLLLNVGWHYLVKIEGLGILHLHFLWSWVTSLDWMDDFDVLRNLVLAQCCTYKFYLRILMPKLSSVSVLQVVIISQFACLRPTSTKQIKQVFHYHFIESNIDLTVWWEDRWFCSSLYSPPL